MTSSPETSGRRPLLLTALVAVLAAAGLGLGGTGWWVAGDDDGSTAPVTLPPTSAIASGDARHGSTSAPTTTAPPTTAPAVGVADLPVPQDAPVDPRADTPAVVHGTLALPTLEVVQPLHEGVTLTAIDRGPSHWPGTALPGEPGNVVVAGHRTTHTQPFHDLDLLRPGDPLTFTMADGATWTYELTAIEVVGPDATHIVDQGPGHTATLFACHPKGSAAQRIVAHFHLVAGSGT